MNRLTTRINDTTWFTWIDYPQCSESAIA